MMIYRQMMLYKILVAIFSRIQVKMKVLIPVRGSCLIYEKFESAALSW